MVLWNFPQTLFLFLLFVKFYGFSVDIIISNFNASSSQLAITLFCLHWMIDHISHTKQQLWPYDQSSCNIGYSFWLGCWFSWTLNMQRNWCNEDDGVAGVLDWDTAVTQYTDIGTISSPFSLQILEYRAIM